MAANTAERRQRLLEALLDAAEAAIAKGGLPALKARDLAREIGCALGAIYNLVGDLDELALRVNSRTLARLDAALTGAASGRALGGRADAIARLTAIPRAYARFARDNPLLWRALFEHKMPIGKPVPDWAIEEQMQLFRHATTPVAVLMPQASEMEVGLMSRTLFAAVHGIVLFDVEEKMIAAPHDALDGTIERFVRLIGAGFDNGAARAAPAA